jgi:hypothetical protein
VPSTAAGRRRRASRFALRNFRAYADELPLPVRKVVPPSGEVFRLGRHFFTGLFVYDLPATAGQRQVRRNTYDYIPPFHGPGSKADTEAPRGEYVEYVLVTGATWRGTIGQISVVFDSRGLPCDRIVSLPSAYTGTCVRGVWRFAATDLEPDRNIELVLLPQ